MNKHECKTCAQTCAGTLASNSLVLGYFKNCLSLQLRWVRRCLLLHGVFDRQLSFLKRKTLLLDNFLGHSVKQSFILPKRSQAQFLGTVNKINFQVFI